MRPLITLIIVMALAFAASYVADAQLLIGHGTRTALHVGLLVITAWLAGIVFDRIHLPKISGYLLVGVLVGPYALNLIPKDYLGDLRFANDLAVALIALTAGGEIRLDWLRGKFLKLLAIIGVDVVIIMGVGIAAVFFGAPLIPFLANEPTTTVFYAAVVAATIMIANSPTVVIAMISDYRAAGPLTQMTLAFTVCKDLVLIILFATVTTVVKGLLDEQTTLSGQFLIGVAAQLLGSIGLGAVLGVLMALYVHRINAHMIFFVIGACMTFAMLGEQHFTVAGQDVHLEPLLLALSAGMLMQNIWPDKSQPLFHTIESMSLPVYCLFFAIAGTKVNIPAFVAAWYVVLAMVAVRAVAVWGGVTLGARLAGLREPWVGKLWLGMIPQAGVTLVLITLVGRAFDEYGWGRELGALLIGMLVIHELLGPIGFRHALFSSGEAGKADESSSESATPAQPAPSAAS